MNCPTCNVEIIKAPQVKTKCKNCGSYIYVRNHYLNKSLILLSEKEKNTYEEEKKNYYFYKKWFRNLEYLGISKSTINSVQNRLRNKWGEPHPTNRDLVWALFNNQIIELTKNKSGYNEFKMLYLQWALFSCEINLDPTKLRQESHKMSLYEIKNNGYKRVEVLAKSGCEECKKLEGKIFDLDEVINLNLLPNKRCTHKLKENDIHSWCRCMYLPIIE